MKKLRVDFNEIQKAMEDVVRDTFDYFLDLETGDVVMFSEEILGEVKARLYEDEAGELEDDIEYMEFESEPDIPEWMEHEVELALEILFDTTDRYPRIPERTSSAAYQAMVSFLETVEDSALVNALSASLDGKGAFKRFKDVLVAHPKERKRWHGYNAKLLKKEITAWLGSVGVEPTQ